MRDNLLGKDDETESFQHSKAATSSSGFGKNRALNVITTYVQDAFPIGEKPGNMMKVLVKVLNGNPHWPEAAIIADLGPIVEITERFQR